MKFTKDALPGIVAGTTVVTFRGWKTAHARVGGRHRFWGQLIEVDDVRQVEAGDVTDDEALLAGARSAAEILGRLGDAATGPIWRVQFRYVGADDRIELRNSAGIDDDHRAAIQRSLQRMDRASKTGPWTTATLRLIAGSPGVVSTVLAEQADLERPAFKVNVRKLKELGLTESLEVGYRLSPLGEAFIGGERPGRTTAPGAGVID